MWRCVQLKGSLCVWELVCVCLQEGLVVLTLQLPCVYFPKFCSVAHQSTEAPTFHFQPACMYAFRWCFTSSYADDGRNVDIRAYSSVAVSLHKTTCIFSCTRLTVSYAWLAPHLLNHISPISGSRPCLHYLTGQTCCKAQHIHSHLDTHYVPISAFNDHLYCIWL